MFSYLFPKKTSFDTEKHAVVDVDGSGDYDSHQGINTIALNRKTQVITMKNSLDSDFTDIDVRPLSYSEVVSMSQPGVVRKSSLHIDDFEKEADASQLEDQYASESEEVDMAGDMTLSESIASLSSDYEISSGVKLSPNIISEMEYGYLIKETTCKKTKPQSGHNIKSSPRVAGRKLPKQSFVYEN